MLLVHALEGLPTLPQVLLHLTSQGGNANPPPFTVLLLRWRVRCQDGLVQQELIREGVDFVGQGDQPGLPAAGSFGVFRIIVLGCVRRVLREDGAVCREGSFLGKAVRGEAGDLADQVLEVPHLLAAS